jgi:secreted PhoX family phosphatase
MTPPAQRRSHPMMVSTILACGLLAACNFPYDNSNGATVGSKGMWIANGTNVVEFVPSQLVNGTNNVAPHQVINSAEFGTPTGLTFDLNGNLWVMDPAAKIGGKATPALLEFAQKQLATLDSLNTIDPVAIITSANLTSPQNMWIDSSGNGWVTDHDSDEVIVFEQAQLGQVGANFFGPVLIIQSADFKGPSGIAFDGSGNLWISNNGNVKDATTGAIGSAGTTIVGILAAHVPAVPLGTRAMPTVPADITLTDDGSSSIQAPWMLAFDTMGNLWSSNPNSSTVVEFAKASLAATGTPTPAVVLSSANVNSIASLNAPKGLCFDDVGNLTAINSAGSFGASFYGEKQLVTGSPTPDTFLVGTTTTLATPQGCVFGTLVN